MTVVMGLCACNDKAKQSSEQGKTANQPQTENSANAAATNGEEGTDVPPVLAVCMNGLPLFAPFNGGDIINEGRILKQSPEKYTKLILNDATFDVTYKEEKNKDLENDDSYLNQYVSRQADKMKGQTYNYADAKAIDKYLKTQGDMTPEGEIVPRSFHYGILASADYLQGRSVIKSTDTTTEDPDGPEFPADVVAKVEKMLGQKVEKSRISSVFGKDEYDFGVMRTKPNDKFGIAAWVLAKGNEVSVWTDTCEVVNEEGVSRVYWSNYDPDEYMEPQIIAVVKGEKGLDIYAEHMATDETQNYYLIRQEGDKMKQIGMGGFYIMYE